jgi:protein translocase SecG subunit
MNILFGFLSVIMFLDCIVLILLVLVQVPKKEAGAGMAFGGSAADALFGAGSGTALTTITKYSAGIFFGAALLMAIMASHLGPAGAETFEKKLTEPGAASSQTPPPLLPATATNGGMLSIPAPVTPASSNSAAPAPSSSSAPAASSNSPAPPPAPPVPQPAVPPPAPVPPPSPATNK